MNPVRSDAMASLAANPANQSPAQASKGHAAAPAPSGISDDRDLARRAAAGDANAYADLVDRYGGRLHAMLLNLAHGDHDLAAEFTQEAFVRAWERLDQFQGGSSFYTWIYRLARNRALDLLDRKRPARLAVDADGGTRDDAPAGTAAPGDAMVREEQRGLVQAALKTLPAASREILLLRDFENLDYAAIADLLELPVGTVKSRISRARGELRDALAGRIGAEDLS
jgi:RNA polymerase sigma-70 factor (ECF subfamily)